MKKVEITHTNRGYDTKEVESKKSNKAKDLYDFVDEHSFDLFRDDTLEDNVVEALKTIKKYNSKLYVMYYSDIDGIIDVYEAMDYEYTTGNDEFEDKIFEILTNNIEDLLDNFDDLADEVMKELSSFNIGINYIGDDEDVTDYVYGKNNGAENCG